MPHAVALSLYGAYALFGLIFELAPLPAPWAVTLNVPGPALVGAALPTAPTAASLRMVRWREIPL